MRLIGLDPGLRNTGWGIIDVAANRLVYVADGTVSPAPKQDLATRLRDLHEGLAQVLAEFDPDEAAVEETFVNKNPASTLKLGEARGVVVLAPPLCQHIFLFDGQHRKFPDCPAVGRKAAFA